MGNHGQCVKGDNCSFRHDMNKRGKVTPSNPSPNSFMRQNERKSSRSRSGRMYRWQNGTLQRMLVLQDQEWLSVLVKSAHLHIVRLMNSRLKGPKKNDDKSTVAMHKKGDWHESVWEPVINYGHDRSGRPRKKRDIDLERGPNVDHLTHDNWVAYFRT